MSHPVERSYLQVLRNRRLAVLLGGDVMSKIGDGMVIVALPLQTLRIHDGLNPAIAISLIEAAPYTLAVAVSLFFGLGRRRFRPRALMLTDCVLRFAVFTGVAVLALAQVLPLWLLGVAARGQRPPTDRHRDGGRAEPLCRLYATKRGERPLIGVAGAACQCTVRQSSPVLSSSRRR